MKATKTNKNNLVVHEHKEDDKIFYLKKDHSNQKNYRDSFAVWFTGGAVEKIQKKYGITEETTDEKKIMLLIGRELDLNFTEIDFDRNQKALEPQTDELKEIKLNIENGFKNTKKSSDSYFSSLKMVLSDLVENKTINAKQKETLLKWFETTHLKKETAKAKELKLVFEI